MIERDHSDGREEFDRVDGPGAPDEDGPMGEADLELLARVADLYEALDPTPEMLPDLVLFGLQAVDLDAELARLVESELLVTAAGSGARAVEQARRVTFTSDHLTVMIAVSDRGQDRVRVDGWATPGGGLRVELRADDTVFSTVCDDDGRFAFDDVVRGMVQLTLSPTADSDPEVAVPVVTPAVHL
jgi:hypothetical protein